MEKVRLKVLGRLHKDLNEKFSAGLDLFDLKDNQLILFCDYSEFDISVGHVFTEVIDDQNGKAYQDCQIILKNVSQQFFQSFDSIPNGWKTVCKFEFMDNYTLDIMYELPQLYGWNEMERPLIFIY
ncbi:hypothetical protein [Chitinophaga pinensis]|uniref:Uncharacterized protein n=1 Tax=Chitinophaga pinensis TaxID=79329 RepID=A0A5C6LRC7_9BACT|nr:hypothetical protein [Chitinophaga pinensis]TWV99431.1 hypothetical protein FEF09_16980 [Chitinophaga pinensis]